MAQAHFFPSDLLQIKKNPVYRLLAPPKSFCLDKPPVRAILKAELDAVRFRKRPLNRKIFRPFFIDNSRKERILWHLLNLVVV